MDGWAVLHTGTASRWCNSSVYTLGSWCLVHYPCWLLTCACCLQLPLFSTHCKDTVPIVIWLGQGLGHFWLLVSLSEKNASSHSLVRFARATMLPIQYCTVETPSLSLFHYSTHVLSTVRTSARSPWSVAFPNSSHQQHPSLRSGHCRLLPFPTPPPVRPPPRLHPSRPRPGCPRPP